MKVKKLVKEVNKLSEQKKLKFVTKLLDKMADDTAKARLTKDGVKLSITLQEHNCEKKNVSGMQEVLKAVGSEFIGDTVKIWTDKETLQGLTTYSIYFQGINSDDDEEQVVLFTHAFPNGEVFSAVGMNAGETGERVKVFCEELLGEKKDESGAEADDDDDFDDDDE